MHQPLTPWLYRPLAPSGGGIDPCEHGDLRVMVAGRRDATLLTPAWIDLMLQAMAVDSLPLAFVCTGEPMREMQCGR